MNDIDIVKATAIALGIVGGLNLLFTIVGSIGGIIERYANRTEEDQ